MDKYWLAYTFLSERAAYRLCKPSIFIVYFEIESIIIIFTCIDFYILTGDIFIFLRGRQALLRDNTGCLKKLFHY